MARIPKGDCLTVADAPKPLEEYKSRVYAMTARESAAQAAPRCEIISTIFPTRKPTAVRCFENVPPHLCHNSVVMRTAARTCAFALGVVLLQTASATLIPRLSFEQLTDASEVIVSGRITNTWAAWDGEHKYIWTHYNLNVASSLKGAPGAVVEFAEPGGAIGDVTMSIGGTVPYAVGDSLVVFLSRMPNGYLRTAGSVQGKFELDAKGRLHAQSSLGGDIADVGNPPPGSSLRTLDGMSLTELAQRVSARLRTTQGRVK